MDVMKGMSSSVIIPGKCIKSELVCDEENECVNGSGKVGSNNK